jgi:hypothetical protein
MAGISTTLLSDPRRRNLAVLAAIAVVSILLALLGLAHQASEVAPRYKPETFFPHLASEVREISHIRVVSKKGAIEIVFKPEKSWVVASHDDYPASFDQLRQTIIGMAALQTIEPKTARADWLHYLDLDPAPHGNGVTVSLMNEKGDTLASIIVGKPVDIGDPNGATGLFVRRSDSNQSWLVRSVFQPKSDPSDWLDKQVLDVDRARIQEADIDPANGPSYEVRRDKITDSDFRLSNPPPGRVLADASSADGVAAAIVGLTFDDVRPAKDFNFSDPAHTARIVTRTFDGVVVTAQTIQQGQDYWTTISAEGAPGKPEAQKEAREIAARASGWAYKLPSYKGQLFMTSLDSLLKPLPNATPSATAK